MKYKLISVKACYNFIDCVLDCDINNSNYFNDLKEVNECIEDIYNGCIENEIDITGDEYNHVQQRYSLYIAKSLDQVKDNVYGTLTRDDEYTTIIIKYFIYEVNE